MASRQRHLVYCFAIGALVLVMLIFGGGMSSARAQEQKTITWAMASIPPGHILEGPEAGTGFCDELVDLMIEELTGYTHTTAIFPHLSRIRQQVLEGQQLCSACLQYMPPGHMLRQEFSYSIPSVMYFSYHLVVRQEDRHLYGEEVSLADLLQDKDKLLGLLAGASFTPEVSTIFSRLAGVEDIWALDAANQIAALRSIPNIYVHTGYEGLESLVKMLTVKRVDYLFLPPAAPMFIARQTGVADQIDFIPVREMKEKVSAAAFTCPNTPWGRQVIAEINTVLEAQRDTQDYKDRVGVDAVVLGRDEIYWSFWEEKVLAVHE